MSEYCAELSEAAGEALSASAVTARHWLLVEVPGAWPRDVADAGALPDATRQAVAAWLAATPGSRVQFLRRPGRARTQPVAFVVRSEEAEQDVRRLDVDRLDELEGLELGTAGEQVAGPLVLVCGHGSRDRCCALRGTAVFGALSEDLSEKELWISSHQGGHRFAANVLVLPTGLQFGRVETAEAPVLVARALEGKIELNRYRGRTCYEPHVQAAEHAVRSAAGLDGVDDLRLAGVENGFVRFRTRDAVEWVTDVEERAGPAVRASCGTDATSQTAFRARVL